jgi:hypothetical protein
MKCSGRIIIFAAAAAFCLGGKLAYGAARPVIGSDFALPLHDSKTAVGKDGLYRLIFDYNPKKFSGASTYAGSALWIIDPNGSLVAAGSPTVPASVGATFTTISPYERSNIGVIAQPSGNTTLVFFYNAQAGAMAFSTFATWTYNSSGTLIAAAAYGPFQFTRIANIDFDSSGKIIVKWQTGPSPTTGSAFAGWVLDEFGTIQQATSYFGPFGTLTGLGKIRINSSNQQIWPFDIDNPDGTFTTVLWTFDSSGNLIHAQTFGPF